MMLSPVCVFYMSTLKDWLIKEIILRAMSVRLFIKTFRSGFCLVKPTNLPRILQRKERNQNFWPNPPLEESELLKIQGKQSNRYL